MVRYTTEWFKPLSVPARSHRRPSITLAIVLVEALSDSMSINLQNPSASANIAHIRSREGFMRGDALRLALQ